MRIQSIKGYLFLVAVAWIGSHGDLRAQDCPLALNVSGTKTTYKVDEPLEVEVRIENRAPSERQVTVLYPTLRDGLVLTFTGGPSSLTRSKNMPNSIDGLSAPTPVPGGGSIAVRIHLQRFFDGFGPGHYEIPWTLEAACEGTSQNSIGRGILRFDITGSQSADLVPIFDDYFQKLLGNWRTADDPYRRAEAIEAFRLSTSPAVIPYLERMSTLAACRS